MTTPHTAMPDSQPEHRPAVLIVPAMAIGSRYYTPVVDAFAEHGWTAFALPHRGFEQGRARASRRHDWSYQDEIDDLASALAALRAQCPTRPVIILGHSLGAQLAAGHELNHAPADGLVTVGGCLPYHRDYPYCGPHIAVMAALAVPLLTTAFGFLPRPMFGSPGARTLMREWARMATTGRTPYPSHHEIRTPSLIIGLEGDSIAPVRAVDAFTHRLFASDRVTRWDYLDRLVPVGASNDHTAWVRTPKTIVDRTVAWWGQVAEVPRPTA